MTDPVMRATALEAANLVPAIEALPEHDPRFPPKAQRGRLLALAEAISKSHHLPVDKVSRWLGFIHGVLLARWALDVDAVRDRTRPLFHAAYAEAGIEIPESVDVGDGA